MASEHINIEGHIIDALTLPTVLDEIIGLGAGGGEAEGVDHVVEAELELAEQERFMDGFFESGYDRFIGLDVTLDVSQFEFELVPPPRLIEGGADAGVGARHRDRRGPLGGSALLRGLLLQPQLRLHTDRRAPTDRPLGRGRNRRGYMAASMDPYALVQAVRAFSMRSRWSRHTNVRTSLRISAPGSRCVSQRIWKPLQMPSTGMPPRAASTTSVITGANRAIAPQRR